MKHTITGELHTHIGLLGTWAVPFPSARVFPDGFHAMEVVI